jgi:hypothetical protein
MMHVQLPDRKWITLCEAVTAFVYGESCDASLVKFYPVASDALLEQLHDAAEAGTIKFRALRRGNNKYQEINPGYFSTTRDFNWKRNEICCWVPCDGEEYEQELAIEWYDVHLERDQYTSLLGDMGVSVQSNSVSDALDNSKIYKTGLQGRPTAIQLALPIAERRLADGDYPDTKKAFAEQIVNAVAKTEPQAPAMTAKALTNNDKFSELWRKRPQRPK